MYSRSLNWINELWSGGLQKSFPQRHILSHPLPTFNTMSTETNFFVFKEETNKNTINYCQPQESDHRLDALRERINSHHSHVIKTHSFILAKKQWEKLATLVREKHLKWEEPSWYPERYVQSSFTITCAFSSLCMWWCWLCNPPNIKLKLIS